MLKLIKLVEYPEEKRSNSCLAKEYALKEKLFWEFLQ